MNAPIGLAFDSARDTLYVANYNGESILVFENVSGADGATVPRRVITGPDTEIDGPAFLFLDAAGDRLYVSQPGGGNVLVFEPASEADGPVAPARTLTLPTTGVKTGVYVDTPRDVLYVADYDGEAILVFDTASTVDGAIAPSETLTLPVNTGPDGLALAP